VRRIAASFDASALTVGAMLLCGSNIPSLEKATDAWSRLTD
jgi:hypothetical protein